MTGKINETLTFQEVTDELEALYTRKNKDYGDSFTDSMETFGMMSSVIRLNDKMKRITSLMFNEQLVDDESVRDTLVDMANYSIMTLMWLGSPDVKSSYKPTAEDLHILENRHKLSTGDIMGWLTGDKDISCFMDDTFDEY